MKEQAIFNYRLTAHLRDWIKRSEEFKSLFNVGRGIVIEREDLSSFFFDNILPNPDYSELIADLSEAIAQTGYQFSSPGNSPNRVVLNLIRAGLEKEISPYYRFDFLRDPTVGVIYIKVMDIVVAELSKAGKN